MSLKVLFLISLFFSRHKNDFIETMTIGRTWLLSPLAFSATKHLVEGGARADGHVCGQRVRSRHAGLALDLPPLKVSLLFSNFLVTEVA